MVHVRLLGAFSGALAVLSLTATASIAETSTPYAGQEHREIKSLSESEIADLLAGRGMGLAKAAELNSYPGPAHVLELADELELSDAQRRATEALFRQMDEQARGLGRKIIDAERDLDHAFAEQRIDAASLKARVGAIAALQGELRAVHLATHLTQRELLSPHQVARYNELRGYGDAAHQNRHRH